VSIKGGLYDLDFLLSHCLAPSIDGADGKKHADCLSASGGFEPTDGGGVSACSGSSDEAQD
jgi:hypothetical protein